MQKRLRDVTTDALIKMLESRGIDFDDWSRLKEEHYKPIKSQYCWLCIHRAYVMTSEFQFKSSELSKKFWELILCDFIGEHNDKVKQMSYVTQSQEPRHLLHNTVNTAQETTTTSY